MVLLVVGQVVADPLTVDWGLLTDFTAHYHFDMKNLVAAHVVPLDQLPYKTGSESGTIQFDLVKERLGIQSRGSAVLRDDLGNANVQGGGKLFFDGPGGFIAIKAHGSLTTPQLPGPAGLEYCVKVNFPKGVLPSGQMLKMQMDQFKPMVEQQVNSVPHTDMQIDGEDVSIITAPLGPPPNSPNGYIGLRTHGAAPFGAGITAPADGHWDPMLKFTSWEHGAGSIEEFSCDDSPDASTSATALLADPEATNVLRGFDELIATLHGAEPVSKAFASVPVRPSAIFQDAAIKELAAVGNAPNMSQPWSSVGIAGAAGAAGAIFGLAVLKLMRGKPSRNEALYENLA